MACPSINPNSMVTLRGPQEVLAAFGTSFEPGYLGRRQGIIVTRLETARRNAKRVGGQIAVITDSQGKQLGYIVYTASRSNPLSRFRVTHNGQTFTITATSKAAAERQVRAMGLGQDVEETGTRPGSRNPVFLPKSLFDSYEVRSEAGGISALNIQTLGGAEKKARELMKKYPCVGFGIYSRKHGSLIKSYKPTVTGAGAPKVDVDNERSYRRDATKEAKAAVRFTLFIDGQEYASYATRQKAAAVGRTEGKGKIVRIKETHENPMSRERYVVAAFSPGSKPGKMYGEGATGFDNRPDAERYADELAVNKYVVIMSDDQSIVKVHGISIMSANKYKVLARRRNPLTGSPSLATVRYNTRTRKYDVIVDGRLFFSGSKRDAEEYAKENNLVARNPLTGQPSHDIPLLRHEGYPQRQSVAIAMEAKRHSRNPYERIITSRHPLDVGEVVEFEASGPLRRVLHGKVVREATKSEHGTLAPYAYFVVTVSAPKRGRAGNPRGCSANPRSYSVGSSFQLTDDAIDNYGEQYRGKAYKVRQWFDHYAKSGSSDPHGHPGYDEGVGGKLYEAEGLPFAVYSWEMEPSTSRRNPEGGEPLDPAASEMYRTFHGVDPSQELVFAEERNLPDAYAELGTLVELWVMPINSRSEKSVKITAPDPDNADLADVVHLASDPEGRQLHFVGGDQELDLKALGFGGREVKENMVIGVITELTYLTKKKFHKLAPTQYFHKLGEESGKQPFLLYDPNMKHMIVAGGNYLVKAEGIVD